MKIPFEHHGKCAIVRCCDSKPPAGHTRCQSSYVLQELQNVSLDQVKEKLDVVTEAYKRLLRLPGTPQMLTIDTVT